MKIEELKTPISQENKGGIYLKGDRSTYRALRNTFNAGQSAYRSLSESSESLADRILEETNRQAWEALSELAEKTLLEISKDLEILSWFTAAQVHSTAPLPNLRDCLSVLLHLTREGIDWLQPIPPIEKLKAEGESEQAEEIAALKIRAFTQLFGEVEGSGLLYAPLTNIGLVADISYGQFLIFEKKGNIDELREVVSQSISSETEVLTEKIKALQEIEKLVSELDALIKSYAQPHKQAPPLLGYFLRHIKELLRAIGELVKTTGYRWPSSEEAEETKDKTASDAENIDASKALDLPASIQLTSAHTMGTAPISTRGDALAAIADLAEYFRKFEPHSPICLLLDRAVRWGGLSAGELYQEILSEGSVGMAQMALMTGLESQGFSQAYQRKQAAAPQSVEHPTLSDYSAAIPQPKHKQNKPKPTQQTPAKPEKQVQAQVRSEPPKKQDTEIIETQPEANKKELELASFEW
ncbi:type VI secretion system protein TssA [Flexibacterium corallicola]|uniref:type VI secretion system protein TssA n=1 Tax=Flexibacterium corallicola TaxID=3037259 RepID=UPI00286F9909|nr:type VI secretion system ImpA family N-terminal domain-containing protein [Pseudovibrio sp. M1P-2-3]